MDLMSFVFILLLVIIVFGLSIGYLIFRRRFAEQKIRIAEESAKRILEESKREAETKRREAILEV
ncbi:MAG: Rnase Y domain-containing protein, partial [bacterium]